MEKKGVLFLFIIVIGFLSLLNTSNSQPTFSIFNIGDTFSYKINMKYNFTTARLNLTFFWDGLKFKIEASLKYTINYSGIVRYSNYTFNYSGDDVFVSLFNSMQATLFGPNDLFPGYNSYQIIVYSLQGNSIPAIKFMDNQGNFLILDLKYGIPLAGYYNDSLLYYNFNLSYTNSLLTTSIKEYVITLSGSDKYNLSLITPTLINSNLGNYTQNYGNVTLNFNFLRVITNNSALVVFPEKTLAKIILNGFTAQALKVVYNQKIYYLTIDTTSERVLLYNKTFSFYPILLKNFLLLYFPLGGNLTFYFTNYKYLVSTENIEIRQEGGITSLWLLWIIIPVLVVVALVLYFVLKRRK